MSKETAIRSPRFLPACRYALLAANLVIFYAYFQHAAEILLAFGKYGAVCDRCAWVFHSQWHWLAADIAAFLSVVPGCWRTLGSRWTARDLAALAIVPAIVVITHQYLSGADWLTG